VALNSINFIFTVISLNAQRSKVDRLQNTVLVAFVNQWNTSSASVLIALLAGFTNRCFVYSVFRGERKRLACSSVRRPDLRCLEQAEIIVLGSTILNNSWI